MSGFSSSFLTGPKGNNGFTTAQLSQFLGYFSSSASPLLNALLKSFLLKGGTITLSGPGNPVVSSTATDINSVGVPTIYVDPLTLPNSGSKKYALSPLEMADALAHELGHALLPNGYPTSSGSSPDSARSLGLTAEGTAIIAEYIVASQLHMTNPDGKPDQYSDASGTLTAGMQALANSFSVPVSTISSVTQLET